MKTPQCELFLEDPAANESHLRDCADCQALVHELDTSDSQIRLVGDTSMANVSLPVTVENLPLAPWEGAGHRSWPLVLGGTLAVVALTAALFAMAGIAPLTGFRDTVTSSVPPRGLFDVLRHFATGLQYAPTKFHLLVGIGFIAVNAVLLILLRRSPRGVDVSSR